MSDERHQSWYSTPDSSVMILHLDPRGDDRPVQFAAVIRNLGGKNATLEVANPWTIMDWETLKGRKGFLRLQSDDTGKATDIRGTVTWARYAVQDQTSGKLSLGLELAQPDQLAHKLLYDNITHSSNDIKGLWNKWDQVRHASQPKTFSTKLGLAATILLVGALGMQLTSTQGFKLFGWVLWLLGTLLVANQTLRFWKDRNVSQ